MAKLAREADDYARVGAELPPTGVGGTANHIIHDKLAADEEAANDPDNEGAWKRLRGDE